jgi:hypothetical protein
VQTESGISPNRRSLAGLLVQPRVFDRDAGGRSESEQQLLIFGTESTINLITQVEIAEDLVA